MRRGLRIVFAVWVALALVVAPFTAARAAPCAPAATTPVASAEAGHRHAGMDHASAHATPIKADPRSTHCGAAHACCVSTCAAPLIAAAGSDPVISGRSTVPRLAEQRLPEGIPSRPPFDPPRATI